LDGVPFGTRAAEALTACAATASRPRKTKRVTLPNIPRTAIFKYTEIPAGKEHRILGGQAVPGRSIEIIHPIRQREAKICRPVAITMPGMRVAGLLHEIGDRSEGRHINDSICTNQRLIPPF
jgi:hypothetical protein